MASQNNKYSLANSLPKDDLVFKKKELLIKFWFILIIIASLELFQDYISAILTDSLFFVTESLSYKIFWLLFIPISIILDYCIAKIGKHFTWSPSIAWSIVLVVLFSIVHLILFSVVLFGISNIIHNEPMTLIMVIYEKFSTRLYIAISIYLLLAGFFFLVRRKTQKEKIDPTFDFNKLVIRNGRNSIILNTSDIKWIAADGAYLDIHTIDKKHVVVGSLKATIKRLPEKFQRIHKSTIINTDKIKQFKSRGNGDYDVIMDDDNMLRLSRNYKKHLKAEI